MTPYEIVGPSAPNLPVIVEIPHSGMDIPDHAARYFAPEFMRSKLNTDWHLDRLFGFLGEWGLTVLKNHIFRYVIDVNRQVQRPYIGHWTKHLVAEHKPEDTPFDGPIYLSRPSDDEIERRIDLYHKPYHAALRRLIATALERFDRICLISIHSFVGGIDEDVCIADGKSNLCDPAIMDIFESAYSNSGFSVARNKVFGGGFTTRQYGKTKDVDPVCIEHRCSNHLLEEELDQPTPPSYKNAKFSAAQAVMRNLYRQIIPGICDIYEVKIEEDWPTTGSTVRGDPRP